MKGTICEFCWFDFQEQSGKGQTDAAQYQEIVNWAEKARGQNPMAFDGFTEWVLRDSEWSGCNLSENEKILTDHLLAPFKEQNRRLRARLEKLAPSGLVNQAVFKALDRFDDELSGRLSHQPLEETIRRVFSDFPLWSSGAYGNSLPEARQAPQGPTLFLCTAILIP